VKTPESKGKDADEPELEIPKVACNNFITEQGSEGKRYCDTSQVKIKQFCMN
jgi:hypothetical protein